MMKFLKFLLPLSLVCCFAGCLDIDENVQVNKDGSGKWAVNTDMSQMIDLLQTYMGKDEMAKKGMQKMDTTIYMKDLVDTLSSLSPDKKALLRSGSIHIKLDVDAKVFTTHMSFPFTDQASLEKLYSAMNDGSMSSTRLLKGLTPGGDQPGQPDQASGGGPDIGQFNNVYDFTCKDGLMARHLNQEKWKALMNDPQMAQIKQASQMGMDISYTTVIQVPRPIKKVDNPLAKLSEDKKTVTIKYNLMDMFDHPEQFSYNIEY
jgi:hypothetical protein